MAYRNEQTGEVYKDTAELLAVRFPHVAPLVPDLNERCGAIIQCNQGHGTLSMQLKGFVNGKLIVPVIDVLLRHFRKDKDEKPAHTQKHAS